MEESARINTPSIPQLLVELIGTGRWIVPADESVFDQMFCEHAGVIFYSIQQMKRETAWWQSLACERSVLLGQIDHARPPGNVDPQKIVLIGDAGIGFDTPLALDYRPSGNDPTVIAYDWNDNKWRTVAANFCAFAESLGL